MKRKKILQKPTIEFDVRQTYNISDGGGIHDVIGTRCDPFTHSLLSGGETPAHTCHQNLIKALNEFLDFDDVKMKALIRQCFDSSDLGNNSTYC